MKRIFQAVSTILCILLFFGFCSYAFRTIDASRSVKYRRQVDQLQIHIAEVKEQLAKTTKQKTALESERDALQKLLTEIEKQCEITQTSYDLDVPES